MVRDISKDILFCALYFAGVQPTSHVPVVLYLPYGSIANF